MTSVGAAPATQESLKASLAPIDFVNDDLIAKQSEKKATVVAFQTCANLDCSKLEGGVGLFKTCSRCRTVYYCSIECQRIDWKHHKLGCVPVSPSKPHQGGIDIASITNSLSQLKHVRKSEESNQTLSSDDVEKTDTAFESLLDQLKDVRQKSSSLPDEERRSLGIDSSFSRATCTISVARANTCTISISVAPSLKFIFSVLLSVVIHIIPCQRMLNHALYSCQGSDDLLGCDRGR